jgi:glycosyltransferase involved in cell wall biosynthesis
MRIAIITGAYEPFMNGVTTSIVNTEKELKKRGWEVLVISPRDFEEDYTAPTKEWKESSPCPGYNLVRLVKPKPKNIRRLFKMLDTFAPETIHIATECTLGAMAIQYSRKRHFAFTTAYHTRFPEIGAQIVREKFFIPRELSRPCGQLYMRLFHQWSSAVMVALPSLANELSSQGFKNIKIWSRGIDHAVFCQEGEIIDLGPRPVFIHYGRLSLDKGFADFCALQLPGTMVAVGEGPAADVAHWKKEFPHVRFMGRADGDMRGTYLRSADAMIFLSETDTFGLTTIEANACGTPVVAIDHFPHNDLIENGVNGWALNDIKKAAALAAAFTPEMRDRCAKKAQSYTWERATDEFVANLVPVAG